MGLTKVVLIETKIFEILVKGGHFIHIIEQGGNVTKELILGLPTDLWVAQALEEYSRSNGDKEFIKTSNLGSSAFIAQRSSNIYGRYLIVVEYRGGSRKSLIIIPKEVEGQGWRKMSMQMCGPCGSAGKNEANECGGDEKFKQKINKHTGGGVHYETYAEVVSCPMHAQCQPLTATLKKL